MLRVWRKLREVDFGHENKPFQPDDQVEIAEILSAREQEVRVAWAALLTSAEDLGPIVGWFVGTIPNGTVTLDAKIAERRPLRRA